MDYFRLAGLPYFTSQKHLVNDCVHLVEVEHQVEFAHVVEVLVQDLDEIVYGLQHGQVVVSNVDADAEVQTGVAAVDDLEVSELHKVSVLCVTNRHHSVHFFDELLLFVVIKLHVPDEHTNEKICF